MLRCYIDLDRNGVLIFDQTIGRSNQRNDRFRRQDGGLQLLVLQNEDHVVV